MIGAFLSALSSIWSFYTMRQEYSPLPCLPLQIVVTGCVCLQRSPFLTQGHPSTGVASPTPCLFAAQHFFQLIHQALKDGQSCLVSEVIFHTALLAILHLCGRCSLRIDFCRLDMSSETTCLPPVTKTFFPCIFALAIASWCLQV